ncbi:hypothetical protein C5B42_05015, partial [Candidatus Cerribacteria bacterium 'Amazon FNV 2010 28 9']
LWLLSDYLTAGSTTVSAGSGGGSATGGTGGGCFNNGGDTVGGGGGGGTNGTGGSASCTNNGGTGGNTGSAGGAGSAGRSLTTTSPNYGTLYTGAVNTTSADLAEYYVTGDTSIQPGDVVKIDGTQILDPNSHLISTKGVLQKADKPYDSGIIGIISTSPGIVLGSLDASGGGDQRQLALSGRVPVKIDPSSPPINVGDYLTASTLPGYARKATQAGYTIAKALEAWTPTSGEDRIDAFVNLSYYEPDREFDQITTLMDVYQLTASASGSLAFQITNTYGEIVNKVVSASQAVIANLTAGAINAQTIAVNNLSIGGQKIEDFVAHIVDERLQTASTSGILASNATVANDGHEDLMIHLGSTATTSATSTLTIADRYNNPVAQIDEGGNATFSGTLQANNAVFNSLQLNDASISGVLYANQIDGLKEKVKALVANEFATEGVATDSAHILASLSGDDYDLQQRVSSLQQAVTTASESANLLTADSIFTNSLTVSGITSLSDTVISGSLSITGQLLLHDNAISSATNTLSLQPEGTGTLNLLAGAMTLSQAGGLVVNTNAYFAQNVTVREDLITNRIRPLDSNLTIALNSPTASVGAKLALTDANNQEVASIDASGSASFTKLIIAADNTPDTSTISGEITSNATTGTAVLAAGQSTIKIISPKIGNNSLVYVTPTSSTNNQVLYVQSRHAADSSIPGDQSYVVIAIDNAIAVPVTFNWWVIN